VDETAAKKMGQFGLQDAYMAAFAEFLPGVDLNTFAYSKPAGFPQGAPISPILSILALEPTLFKLACNIMMYADDGLKWGKEVADVVSEGLEPLETKEPLKYSGIKYSTEKSG